MSKQVHNEMDTISNNQIHLSQTYLKACFGWLKPIPDKMLMKTSKVSKCWEECINKKKIVSRFAVFQVLDVLQLNLHFTL